MARLVCGSVLVLSFSLSVRAADGTSLIDDLVWNRYRSPANGVLLTVIDDNARPSPLTINGSPRAFEASAISTALYLDALVLRNQGPRARDVLGALLNLSHSSGVPGLIARGVYPNGKPYTDPSYLDYAVLHYAFWRYYNSPIASEANKHEIRSVIAADLARMEEHAFNIFNEVDDPTSLHELGYAGPGQAEHLLAMLLAGASITGDPHWREVYEHKLRTRIDKMARYDRALPQNAWSMHRSLLSLKTLEELDRDERHRAVFVEGIRSAVAVAARQTEAFREYLKWKADPGAAQLTKEPVASPFMVPLFSAHEVIRYWHGGGLMPEFETAPLHRTVWYSAESAAALMLAGDQEQIKRAAAAEQEMLASIDFRAFRDVRPLVAIICAAERKRARGLQ